MNNTETNRQKLQASYARFKGDTHNLSFEKYAENALDCENAIRARVGLKPLTLESFLSR